MKKSFPQKIALIGFILGLIFGGYLGNLGKLFPFLWRIICVSYDRVGITIIALFPLAVWALITIIRVQEHSHITLAYIGATAQRIGLLGTVIGIVAATVEIGHNLHVGASDAVVRALPAVGQALISTAVGFVIALVCDFVRYLDWKHNSLVQFPNSSPHLTQRSSDLSNQDRSCPL